MAKPKKKDQPSLKERYELLIRARNIHFDNYIKWITYFYIAIAAIFVAYYTILSKQAIPIGSVEQQTAIIQQNEQLHVVEKAILFLGFVVSILWYWSSKGFYYWNIHFITMVQYYEKVLFNFDKKERVYLVFANKEKQNDFLLPHSGANISTSKLAIFFSFIVSVVWGVLLFSGVFQNCISPSCQSFSWLFSFGASVMSVLFLTVVIAPLFFKSNQEHFPDLRITSETLRDK